MPTYRRRDPRRVLARTDATPQGMDAAVVAVVVAAVVAVGVAGGTDIGHPVEIVP